MKKTLKSFASRSQFIVSLWRTIKAIGCDMRAMVGLIFRPAMCARYVLTNKPRKLQIGCGKNPINGWLNTDVRWRPGKIAYLNATRRTPFGDGTFDYIFSEHMIEHFDYATGKKMLAECFRIMSSGGTIRIATPGLERLVEFFGDKRSWQHDRYKDWLLDWRYPDADKRRDSMVINCMFTQWGHKFIYDTETLTDILQDTGFVDVTVCKPGQSEHETLKNLEGRGTALGSKESGDFETIVVEARKA